MPVTQVRSKQQLLVTDNVSFGGLYKITNLVDPTGAQDAATKGYVDAVKQALDIKDSVRAATTANITLSGTQTIDGVALIAGDRILVKDQTLGQDNGIYVVAAGAWSRSVDANAASKINPGMFVFVEEGTANGDNGYVLTTNGTITLGTTPLAFTQFSGAGQVDAGAGLLKTGNTINVGTASVNRIVVNANDIDLATVPTVSAATYGNTGFNVPNITVDAYGRLTAAANRDLFGTPAANLVFASPSGSTGAPTFRALVELDIPNHSGAKIQSGLVGVTFGGTGVNGSAAANGTLLIGNGTGYTLTTLTAVANRTTITNASGSITIDISSAYIGQGSITTVGTIGSGVWNGTAIAAANGGTGQTTYVIGDILYASATNALSRLAGVATGNVLISGGVGAIPSWNKVNLDTTGVSHITGTLRTGNGGTGLIATPTNGQLLIGNGTGYTLASLGAGTGISITNPSAGAITIAINSADVILAANYVVRENPTGNVDGTNATFTLAATPLAGKEMVFVNGVLQNSGAGNDYTITGATITFLAGAIPQTGDIVRVTYLK